MSFLNTPPLSIPTGPAEAPSNGPALSHVQTNSGYGSTVTFRDGVATVTSNEPTSVNVADIGNGHTGILGTARSAGGSPIAGSAITATSLVDCDGMQTTAANAERMGYLVKNPATGLYMPGPEARASEEAAAEKARVMKGEPNKAPEKAPQAAPEAFDAATEASFNHLQTSTDAGSRMAAMMQITSTGIVEDRTLNALASQMRVEPSEVAGRLDQMRSAMSVQATEAVRKMGADPEDVFRWANANARKALGDAVMTQMTMRTTAGYRDVFNAYLADLPNHAPGVIMATKFEGGVTAQKIGKAVVLNIPGLGQVGFAQAMKQGLVKIARG